MALRNPSRRHRDWSSLPDLVIFHVATRLNPIQFSAFAGVCKSWRSVCNEYKENIKARQPPLFVNLRFDTKLSCSLYKMPLCEVFSIPEKRIYYKSLPSEFLFDGVKIFGFFHGYVVFLHMRKIHLANPFTEHIISMAPVDYTVENCLLTALPGTSESMVVAVKLDFNVTSVNHVIMVCRPGVDDRWDSLPFSAFMSTQQMEMIWAIDQLILFKGRIFILSDNVVHIIEIEIEPVLYVKNYGYFKINEEDFNWSNLKIQLIATDKYLWALQFPKTPVHDSKYVCAIYMLQDFENINWKKVENVGGRTLFTSRCSGFVPDFPGLVGWGEGWDDRVFLNPFWRIKINGNLEKLPRDYYRFNGTNSWDVHSDLAWVSANNF